MDDGGDTEGDGGDTGVGEEGEERMMKKGSRNHEKKPQIKASEQNCFQPEIEDVTEGEEEGSIWGSVEFASVITSVVLFYYMRVSQFSIE